MDELTEWPPADSVCAVCSAVFQDGDDGTPCDGCGRVVCWRHVTVLAATHAPWALCLACAERFDGDDGTEGMGALAWGLGSVVVVIVAALALILTAHGGGVF